MVEKYSQYLERGREEAIICPSILSADFRNLSADINKIEGHADWVHIDVMDGVYVPNISFGIPIVRAVKKCTQMPLDVHLMIVDPGRYIDDFAEAGADMIVVHQETCVHLHRVLDTIKAKGVSAGVALNPGTPVSTVEEVLPYVDMILLMTVDPGFGGQSYINSMTDKISRLRTMLDAKGLDVHIQVDGGIGPDNIRKVFKAGANAIVAGSSVFSGEDPAGAIRELRKCLL